MGDGFNTTFNGDAARLRSLEQISLPDVSLKLNSKHYMDLGKQVGAELSKLSQAGSFIAAVRHVEGLADKVESSDNQKFFARGVVSSFFDAHGQSENDLKPFSRELLSLAG